MLASLLRQDVGVTADPADALKPRRFLAEFCRRFSTCSDKKQLSRGSPAASLGLRAHLSGITPVGSTHVLFSRLSSRHSDVTREKRRKSSRFPTQTRPLIPKSTFY